MKKDLNEFQTLLELHTEWLAVDSTDKTFPVMANEIELEESNRKVLFSILDADGYHTWRIKHLTIESMVITLTLTRNFGKDELRLQLIPRSEASEFRTQIELARMERANQLAASVAEEISGVRPIRVELNKENGRFAQIIVETDGGKQKAILADVSESLSPEALLTSAIIWLSKLKRRKNSPIEEVWIVSEKKMAAGLKKLHACLEKSWKEQIELWKVDSSQPENKLARIKQIRTSDLWRYQPKKLRAIKNSFQSKTCREIIKTSPSEIDFIYVKNGETLRYLGLPFLRVRENVDKEEAWFGIDQKRRLLNEDSLDEFYDLIENIKKYRRYDSQNLQHAFFDSAPEAWLESLLQRNIKRLDENLILSPIYNQFRTSRDKIDLLALRKDGRLVIIELKVSTDREMIFQAVDYWRKIEHQRRKGLLDKAKLFGDRKIAEKPTIVYLVAPTLSYHRDFELLSKTISQEIELFRFDLAEDWRKEIRVLGRKKL